jgi:two-component system nitrate/nitrite response regulator NarL
MIVEARTLLREGLTSLLHDTCYKVVASVASVAEIREPRLQLKRPALIVLGVWGAYQETLRAVQSARRIIPASKIVAIGERFGDVDFQEILDSGVDAVVFNVGSSEALLKAIDLVFLGQQLVFLGQPTDSDHYHEDVSPIAPGAGLVRATTKVGAGGDSTTTDISASVSFVLTAHLSDRERQVLLCLARGDSNKAIARSCSISEATVKAHVKAILRKISVRNRTQAAIWARENCSAGNAPSASASAAVGPPDRHPLLAAPRK